jgi:Ser/Thr protein kinase RdoA (MazF antagonist)
MNYADIIRSFGFEIESDTTLKSLYDYAPVFRVANSDGLWIVKRTQPPLSRAQSIVAWTQSLAGLGISVVTPAVGFGENPRVFQNDEGKEQPWVVYPFIDGQPYEGNLTPIRDAGDLLGKIHAAGMDKDFGLKQRDTVVTIEAEEIEGDINKILGFIQQAFPNQVEDARSLLRRQTQRYFQQVSPQIANTNLPVTNCSNDYKASNLIYHKTGPVLIDPDNGGRIPRAYDLAIATLLFHNEGKGPARVFTSAEWQAFLEGYTQHVQLDDVEKSHWEDTLLCAWVDEALWLLQDDEKGWADPMQSKLLRSLLFADLASFALPNT